jgi:hypothetical protein
MEHVRPSVRATERLLFAVYGYGSPSGEQSALLAVLVCEWASGIWHLTCGLLCPLGERMGGRIDGGATGESRGTS